LHGGDSTRLDSALTAYRSLLQQWNDNLNRILALVHSYFGESIRMRLQLELYATYAAIGEELEEFVAEVRRAEQRQVRVRRVGGRLDELDHRVYSFNVEVLRALRDNTLGPDAPRETTFKMSLPIHPRFGVEGNQVREVQQALRRGGATLTVDGHFGRETELALMEFQRSHDMTVDGVAGPATLAALGVRGEEAGPT
jgi:murein L,D-transpeptidase YcbB/YkuD